MSEPPPRRRRCGRSCPRRSTRCSPRGLAKAPADRPDRARARRGAGDALAGAAGARRGARRAAAAARGGGDRRARPAGVATVAAPPPAGRAGGGAARAPPRAAAPRQGRRRRPLEAAPAAVDVSGRSSTARRAARPCPRRRTRSHRPPPSRRRRSRLRRPRCPPRRSRRRRPPPQSRPSRSRAPAEPVDAGAPTEETDAAARRRPRRAARTPRARPARPRRPLAGVLAAAGGALVLAGGYAIGGAGGGAEPGTPAAPAGATAASPRTPLTLAVPGNLEGARRPRRCPGSSLVRAAAAARRRADGDGRRRRGRRPGPGLLPAAFTDALGTVPRARRDRAARDREAYRYAALTATGDDDPSRVLLAPTTAGVATIACTRRARPPPAARGRRDARAGDEPAPLPLGPSERYAARARRRDAPGSPARRSPCAEGRCATRTRAAARPPPRPIAVAHYAGRRGSGRVTPRPPERAAHAGAGARARARGRRVPHARRRRPRRPPRRLRARARPSPATPTHPRAAPSPRWPARLPGALTWPPARRRAAVGRAQRRRGRASTPTPASTGSSPRWDAASAARRHATRRCPRTGERGRRRAPPARRACATATGSPSPGRPTPRRGSTRPARPARAVDLVVLGGPRRRDAHRRSPAGRHVSGAGRAPTVTLTDRSMSRRHLVVAVATGGVTVSDLGSSNGSFVEGAALADARVLRDGDAVEAGRSLLAFEPPPPRAGARRAAASRSTGRRAWRGPRPRRRARVPAAARGARGPRALPLGAAVIPLAARAARCSPSRAAPAASCSALLTPAMAVYATWRAGRSGRRATARRSRVPATSSSGPSRALERSARPRPRRRAGAPRRRRRSGRAAALDPRLWERRPGDADFLAAAARHRRPPAGAQPRGCRAGVARRDRRAAEARLEHRPRSRRSPSPLPRPGSGSSAPPHRDGRARALAVAQAALLHSAPPSWRSRWPSPRGACRTGTGRSGSRTCAATTRSRSARPGRALLERLAATAAGHQLLVVDGDLRARAARSWPTRTRRDERGCGSAGRVEDLPGRRARRSPSSRPRSRA